MRMIFPSLPNFSAASTIDIAVFPISERFSYPLHTGVNEFLLRLQAVDLRFNPKAIEPLEMSTKWSPIHRIIV